MKTVYIVIVAVLMGIPGLRAQDTAPRSAEGPSNSIALYWGIGKLKKQDLIFSPFVHQDWSPVNVVLNYEHSGKLEHRASIRYGQYSAHTGDLYSFQLDGDTYPKYEHSFTEVDLNYSLGYRISEKENWTFILGGRFRNRFQISYYEFGPSSHFGYHVPIGLDAWFNVSFDPGSKHHLEGSLNLPLFSYVARSPYMGQDAEYMERISVHGDIKIFFQHLASGELQSWGTSQIVDLGLRYKYSLSDRWELGAAYEFSMNLHAAPRDIKSYENLFLVGTTFKF